MVRFMMQLTGRLGDKFALAETDYCIWRAQIDESWRGWTGPHGGVIAGLLVDATTLAVLADALPPGFFPTLSRPGAAPTVAFSMHLHTDPTRPTQQPVLVRAANASTGGGWSVDEIDIWDRGGALLACSPRPAKPAEYSAESEQ
jgi:hypothetical protein